MLLYDLLIRFFYLLIYLLSFFNKKARLYIRGRREIYNDGLKKFAALKKPCVWFHCSSMGEYQDGKKLIELVLKKNDYKVMITFYSPSGYEYYKDKTIGHHVAYLPYDTAWQMQQFISTIVPSKIIVCRNDLWPNMINTASKKNIPLYLVDYSINASWLARFPFKKFYQHLFSKFAGIMVQTSFTKDLLTSTFSQKNVMLAGNTRFDALDEKPLIHNGVKQFTGDNFVLIFGSALPNDLKLLYTIDSRLKNKIKIIVVEHEPCVTTFEYLKRKTNFSSITYTGLKNSVQPENFDLLYVDVIGILKDLYFASHMAFIGGGFDPIGIHNILEPAIAGNYIAFGPNYRHYNEALDLVKIGDTKITGSAETFNAWLENCMQQQQKSFKNKNYVLTHKGASQTCYAAIFG